MDGVSPAASSLANAVFRPRKAKMVNTSRPPSTRWPGAPRITRARTDPTAAADNGGLDGWGILARLIRGAPGPLAAGARLGLTICAPLGPTRPVRQLPAAGLTPA